MKLIGEIERAEICTKLSQNDIFLFPTYTEGFPLSILEAMSVGIPIITTKVGAIYDILEEDGAKYVDVGNVEQIIERIKELSEKVIRSRMGAWNKEKLNKYYSDKAVINQLNDIYIEVMEGEK